MVAFSTTTANDLINMADPLMVDYLPNFDPGMSPTSFAWYASYGTATYTEVAITGSGFTYSPFSQELTGGTISSITIDRGVNSPSGSSDILITGTEGLVVSNIKKTDPVRFWDEVLKGNDTFDLSGLSRSKVGVGFFNTIFGDDLSARALLGATTTTDAGGNDTILGSNNRFDLIGDAHSVAGFLDGLAVFRAIYDAGDDTITSGPSSESTILTGDVKTVGDYATVNGGNDILNNSTNSGFLTLAVGDVFEQIAGTVNGGDDSITLRSNMYPGAVGDVYIFSGGTLVGGDDMMIANDIIQDDRKSYIVGDVHFIRDATTANKIRGGSDNITGGSGHDVISGDIMEHEGSSAATIGGNDLLSGGGGNDLLYGELYRGSLVHVSGGNDRLYGGAGSDELHGQTGNDLLDGEIGDDTIVGGIGADTVSYYTALHAVRVSLAIQARQNTLGAGADTISEIENLEGSRFNDVLTDSSGANILNGHDGHDVLRSGLGNDRLIGGSGRDTADYSLATSRVVVTLATQIASGVGIGRDTLVQVENASTGSGSDALTGSAGANTLKGNAGLDNLAGRGGIDTLTGGRGTRDDFTYLAKSDSIGTGDLITDFESGLDNIDVSALSTRLFTFSGQRTTFNAATAPEVRYVKDAAHKLTHVYADVNGDNVIDLHIRLTGVLTLTGGDIIL